MESTNETKKYELKCTALTINIGCAFNKDLCIFESPLAGDYVISLYNGSELDAKVCVSTVTNENVSVHPLPVILKLNEGDRVSFHIDDNILRNLGNHNYSFSHYFFRLRGIFI